MLFSPVFLVILVSIDRLIDRSIERERERERSNIEIAIYMYLPDYPIIFYRLWEVVFELTLTGDTMLR